MTGQISVSIYEDEVSLPSRTNTWDSGLGYYPEIGNKLQIRRRKMKVGNEQNALAKTSKDIWETEPRMRENFGREKIWGSIWRRRRPFPNVPQSTTRFALHQNLSFTELCLKKGPRLREVTLASTEHMRLDHATLGPSFSRQYSKNRITTISNIKFWCHLKWLPY